MRVWAKTLSNMSLHSGCRPNSAGTTHLVKMCLYGKDAGWVNDPCGLSF
jgi:hypothetical protein